LNSGCLVNTRQPRRNIQETSRKECYITEVKSSGNDSRQELVEKMFSLFVEIVVSFTPVEMIIDKLSKILEDLKDRHTSRSNAENFL